MTDMPGAGPELDELVAEALGGDWHLDATFEPSAFTADAIAALEEWREQHPDWFATIDVPRWKDGDFAVTLVEDYEESDGDRDVMEVAPTLAEAICRAIVLASRERPDTE